MKTIKEINKKFDEKFSLPPKNIGDTAGIGYVPKRQPIFEPYEKVKSFYTQQILSLIEELIGEDEKHNYSSQGSTQTKKMDARNAFRKQQRVIIRSYLK